MKNGSKRTISRVLAFIMIVSSIFTNMVVANAVENGADEAVATPSAVALDADIAVASLEGDASWSADDLEDSTGLAAAPTLGDGTVFTFSVCADNKSKVNGNKKTFSDEAAFTKRLQAGATGSLEKNEGVFTVNAPSAGTLTVYFVTGSNSSGRSIKVYNAAGEAIATATSGPIEDAATYVYEPLVAAIPAAGEYKVVGEDGAINYYGMTFTADAGGSSGDDSGLAKAEAGKSYSADFTNLGKAGESLDGTFYAENTIGLSGAGITDHGSGHGVTIKNDDTVYVSVAGSTDVTFTMCAFSAAGAVFKVTDEAGKAYDDVVLKAAADKDEVTFSYKGDATVLAFTVSGSDSGQSYLHAVATAPASAAPELAAAEAGKAYTADFVAYANETGNEGGDFKASDDHTVPTYPLNGVKFGDGTIVGVSSKDTTFYSHDTTHGAAIGAGDVIYVNVSGEAKITLSLCQYGGGTAYTVTDAATGEVIGKVAGKGATDGEAVSVDYYGEAATLAITCEAGGAAFLHKLEVANADIIEGKATGFTLFLDDISYDVSGVDDTGKEIITKTIDPGVFTGELDLNTGEKLDLGNAKIELIGNGTEKFVNTKIGAIENVDISRGGRDHVNGYKAGGRNADANNIPTIPKQGDGTAMLFTPVKSGMIIVYYATQANGICSIHEFNADGTKATGGNAGASFPGQYRPIGGQESYAIDVKAGCTYVMSTTGATNNLAFVGLKYAPNEPINVQLTDWTEDGKYSYDNVEITFTDKDLGKVAGTIKKGDTSITLMKGHTYTLTTNDGGAKASIAGSTDFEAVDEGPVTIDMTEIPDTTLRGSFVGDSTAIRSVKSLKFVSMVSGVEFPAVINKDGTYEVEAIKPGEFNAVVECSGYTTYDRAHVETDFDNVDDVYLESTIKDYYELSEEINSSSTPLKFNNVSGNMKYNQATAILAYTGDQIVVPVDGVKTVTVGGWYSGSWDINGQNAVSAFGDSNANNCVENSYTTNGTETSVTITILDWPGEEGNTNNRTFLRYIKISDPAASEFKPVVSIPRDYATLTDAVAGIKAMDRPEGEAGRVTIELNKDLQEQVVIDAPYVTLKGNGHEITWYYGVTGKYYSCDADGYYNERLFYDKYEKHEASGQLWGAVVIIRGDYFRAENTTFRNTFNYEVTPKEVEDGAESVGVGLRTLDTDVTVYGAKERSNAFYTEAKGIECYKCNILSSQDTLGRNGSSDGGYSCYFKDCVIGGNTDYICGEFAAIFDNCELQWKSYKNDPSHNADGTTGVGYIVAPKTAPYVFRNCKVTTTGDEGDDPVIGNWGRTWGLNSQAYFINCEANGHIKAKDAWQEMNKDDHLTAVFGEFGNTNHGDAFITDSAYATEVTPAKAKELLSDDVLTSYVFSDSGSEWTPYYYDEEVEPDEPTELGDVDEDGDIDVIDASKTLQYTLKGNVSGTFNKKNAEVSGNKTIDSEDVALILQKVLDSTFIFPILAPPEESTEGTTEGTPGTEPVGSAKIFVVGDSTGCHYAETADVGYYYKRVGFGDAIADYFNAEVVNLALSGRSSKSFLVEPEYEQLKAELKAGDYLIIAFGHNDEKIGEVDRGTYPSTADKPTNSTTEGSFKKSLYDNYIKLAEDKGATPILCTPIVRYPGNTTSGFSASELHQTNGGDYAKDIIDLGAEKNVAVIDNTALTKTLYETTLGFGTVASLDKETGAMTAPTGAAAMHAATRSGGIDKTHINGYGAKYIAYLMSTVDSPIKAYAKAGAAAPTEADLTAAVNPDWSAPATGDPQGDNLVSALWKTTSPWYATVYGDVGGQEKIGVTVDPETGDTLETPIPGKDAGKDVQYYNINETAPGSVAIKIGDVEKNVTTGKIASGSDGLALYYQPFDAEGNLEIKAKVKINSYQNNNQVAFGAIITDSILVDTYDSGAVYNYVAASPLRLTKIGTTDETTGAVLGADSTYARIDGALKYGDNIITEDLTGKTVDVSIVKKGDEFTVTWDGQTTTYTVPMTGKIYAGVYAARCADVEFTDVTINNEIKE